MFKPFTWPTGMQALDWPLSALDAMQQVARKLPRPQWLIQEMQSRSLLLINHVLMQDTDATARLKRHAGKTVRFQAEGENFIVRLTPAGLLEWLPTVEAPDLDIQIPDVPWSQNARKLMQGEQPDVQIYGDVMLAAEVTWMREHLSWDIEDDLAKLVGDVPATWLAGNGKRAFNALRDWLKTRMPAAPAATPPAAEGSV